MGEWTFLSNYGHVLVCLARNNEARLRDVALQVGMTERAVQKIVKDMQEAGFLTVTKQGRCNRYRINKRKSLRHGLESHCNVGKLLALLANKPARAGSLMIESPIGQAVHEQPISAPPAVVTPPVVVEGLDKTETRKVPTKQARKKPVKDTAPVETRQQGKLF